MAPRSVRFGGTGFPVHIGAEVKNFEAETIIHDPKLLKFASRSHRFALAAAEEAFVDAGLRPDPSTSERWGLSVGAGMLGVSFDELKAVQHFCAPDGDFNADGLLNDDFPANPVGFCRSQNNSRLSLLQLHF